MAEMNEAVGDYALLRSSHGETWEDIARTLSSRGLDLEPSEIEGLAMRAKSRQQYESRWTMEARGDLAEACGCGGVVAEVMGSGEVVEAVREVFRFLAGEVVRPRVRLRRWEAYLRAGETWEEVPSGEVWMTKGARKPISGSVEIRRSGGEVERHDRCRVSMERRRGGGTSLRLVQIEVEMGVDADRLAKRFAAISLMMGVLTGRQKDVARMLPGQPTKQAFSSMIKTMAERAGVTTALPPQDFQRKTRWKARQAK